MFALEFPRELRRPPVRRPGRGAPPWHSYCVSTQRKRAFSSKSATARSKSAKQRRNELATVDNDLTDDQWTALLDAWGGCAYCGAEGITLQQDCIEPVSRGGRYTLSNVVPACASCCTSKRSAELSAWLRRKKFDEGAFLLRQATIVNELLPEA